VQRRGGRGFEALRPVNITLNYRDFAAGSAYVTWGRTHTAAITGAFVALPLAQKGIAELARIQEEALSPWLPLPW
jgi:ribonuclease PH